MSDDLPGGDATPLDPTEGLPVDPTAALPPVPPAPPSWAAPLPRTDDGSAVPPPPNDIPTWGAPPPPNWGAAPPPPAPPRLRPLGVGEILDGAIKVWRTDFRRLFPYVALFSLPAQIAVALLRISVSSDGNLTTTDSNGIVRVDGSGLRATIGALVVITLITLLSTLVITAALTAYLTDRILDRPADLKACLRVGWSRILPLIGVGFLVAMGAGLALLACIIPGIILFIRWNFASQIVVVERARPIAAMKRSFWLTEGRFWPVLAILLISGILTGIITSIFSGILTAVVVAITGADSVATDMASLVTNTIASGLTLPFSAAVSVITYLDLRVRREGLDLQLLAQGIRPAP